MTEAQLETSGIVSTGPEMVRADADATGEAFEVQVTLALRTSPPAWLHHCLEQINRLRDLQPNWDSYGAQRVESGSLTHAKALIKALASVDTVEVMSRASGSKLYFSTPAFRCAS